MAGCEDDDLIVLAGFFQAINYIRPYIDTSIHSLIITIGKLNLEDNITVLLLNIINTVN